MKKIINFIKDNKLLLITALLSTIVLITLYILNEVTPFGGKSLLCIDFYHQYGPMLAELYDRIRGFSNLTYSFNIGLGIPFFRNFMNYLSSPFNIIMLFFNRSNLITSYSFIIGAKAIASSVTMVYYLSKKFNNKKLYLIPLGIVYGFNAYFTAYYWNLMWLDGMVLIPLVTLGIENIVNKRKWKFYSIILGISILSNYFIGYMICIYSVVYYIIYLINKSSFKKGQIKSEIKKIISNILLYSFASLIGGMLSFFLLIPLVKSISSISATGGTFPTTQYYAFEIVDFIKANLSGVKRTVLASDSSIHPNITTGILTIGLFFTFLVNYEIPLKKKICYLLLLGFFIFAFFSPQLDFIMQAFHVPNDLPYRYSFLYSFVMVVISAYALININKIKYPIILLSYILLMILLAIISLENYNDIPTNMVYINMLLLTLYFVFFTAKNFYNKLDNLFYIAIAIVSCIEVLISTNYNWDITQVLNTFYEDYNYTEETLNYIKNNDKDLMYRIENTNYKTLNDGAWFNYNGVNTFSSMAYESLAKFNKKLGLLGNEINSFMYTQTTPIYDLMFNIKYILNNNNDNIRYSDYYIGTLNAYKFDYNVGLAFAVNKDIKNIKDEYLNAFEIENNFISLSTGINDVLKPVNYNNRTEVYNDGTKKVLKYAIKNNYDNYYFYIDSSSVDYFAIGNTVYYLNDQYYNTLYKVEEIKYNNLDSYEDKRIINIKSNDEYIYIYISYTNFYTIGFDLYTIDNELFKEAYNILNKNKLNITSYKEDKILGNINLEDDKTIYTSIPYDSGWKVYIDGKETKTSSIFDSLLIFDCPKGEHTITLKYKLPYFGIGLICTTLAIIALLFDKIIIVIKKIYKKNTLAK